MSKPSALISLQTSQSTDDKAFGRAFMQQLIDQDVRLVPELISASETYKDRYLNLDDMIERWWAMPIATYYDGRPTGV